MKVASPHPEVIKPGETRRLPFGLGFWCHALKSNAFRGLSLIVEGGKYSTKYDDVTSFISPLYSALCLAQTPSWDGTKFRSQLSHGMVPYFFPNFPMGWCHIYFPTFPCDGAIFRSHPSLLVGALFLSALSIRNVYSSIINMQDSNLCNLHHDVQIINLEGIYSCINYINLNEKLYIKLINVLHNVPETIINVMVRLQNYVALNTWHIYLDWYTMYMVILVL